MTFAALRVSVVDETKRPVSQANVIVRDGRSARSRVANSEGVVRVDSLVIGAIGVEIRRIGYKPASVSVRVGPGENAITVHVNGAVAQLDPIRVISNKVLSARLDDFEIRLAHKEASAVVTRDEIERRNPIVISQMLRNIQGIRIADSMGSKVAVSTRGQKMVLAKDIRGRDVNAIVECVLRVSVDGVVLPALTNIDSYVPKDIHGVEIFLGPSRIPPQFAGVRTDNWCGLIAIWTRDGS